MKRYVLFKEKRGFYTGKFSASGISPKYSKDINKADVFILENARYYQSYDEKVVPVDVDIRLA